MSKLKAAAKKAASKLKAKVKPTYEKAEMKPLTEDELAKLNREVILEMYRKQRFGKLKALQQEIVDRTGDEKSDLRDIIVENAKKRLKRLDKEKKLRINLEDGVAEAREFADAITGIEDEEGALMKVLKYQEHKKQEFDFFMKTLDANVGSKQLSKRLKQMIKNNKWAASMIALIQKKNPKAMDDINLAINKGDYDELKKAILKGDDTLNEKQVDYVFAAALTNTMGKEEVTGNKTIDGLITRVKNLRYIGHTYSMKKAAKAADVSFWFVMRFGQETLASLDSMDNRLQSHKHLIENKTKLTQKDHERIKFIDSINQMRKTYDAKVEEKGLKETFEDLLRQHLNKKFEDPKFKKKIGNVDKERLTAEIIANAQLDQLKLYQIFDLTYGDDKERGRLFFHGMTRGMAIGYQFVKNLYLEEDRHLRKAFVDYFVKRGANREIRAFRKNAKKWGLNEIVKDLDDLEARAKKLGTPLGDLADEANKYKIETHTKNISGQELYDRDMIFKKYHILARRATEIMSKEAKPTINAGQVLDSIKASKARMGIDFMSETADNMVFKSGTLEAIFGKGKVPSDLSKVTGEKLIGAYGDKLVELKTMQDVTQARFKGLAESIEANVESSFGPKMRGQLKGIDEARFRNRVNTKLDELGTTSRVKKWGKRLIIPAIIVGIAGKQMYSGQMKTREVAWNLAEAGLGFVPVVGTLLDFKAAFTGRNLAGKELSIKEQVVSGVFGVIGGLADVLTVVGGSGLALRATVGGMRGTRRAMRAGKTMEHLAEAGHVADLGVLGKAGRWFGGRYNAAARLERATEATIAAKATKQAGHISDINHEIRGLEGLEGIDHTRPLNSEITRLEEAMGKVPSGASKSRILDKLEELKKMQKGMEGNATYLSAFKKAAGREMKVVTKSDWTIIRWMQSGAMWTLEKFRKAKAGLKRIGVSNNAIKEYEKAFEEIHTLRQTRLDQMEDIAKLMKNKNMAEKDFRALEAMKDSARFAPDKKKLLEKFAEERRFIAEQRELKIKHERLLREKKTLDAQNKSLREAFDQNEYLRLKNKLTQKMSYERFVELAGQGKLQKFVKGHEARAEVIGLQNRIKKSGLSGKLEKNVMRSNEINKELKKSDDSLKALENDMKANKAEIGTLDESVSKADQKWREDAFEAQNAVKNADKDIAKAKDGLGRTNARLNEKAAEQFRMQSEMALKAERITQRYDSMRKLSHYMQIGGMAMGAIWFFSDGKADPVDQMKTAGKVVKYSGKAAGKVAHELYIADHSGKGSINEFIEHKVHVLEQKHKMEGILAKAREEGRSELDVLAENSNTLGAQEIIRKRGLAAKIAAIHQKGGVALREIVTGDAAKKAGEKLAG